MAYQEISITDNLPTTFPKLTGMLQELYGTSVINLPSLIYTLEGVETNIYFEQIVNSIIPREHREFTVTGTTDGKLYKDFWRNNSAKTADYSATLNLIKHGTTEATKALTIKVATATAGNGITRKVLVIGDSNTASDITVTTLYDDLFGSTGLKITPIGTKGTGVYKHEGIAGKTFAYFNEDAASPFVFSGSFNFSQYLSTNGFTMGADDWVIFHLGTNDLFTTSAAGLATRISDMKADLNAMIANIQSAVPGIRVGICLCMPPASSQDAWPASGYDTTINRHQFYRNLHTWWSEAISYYDTAAQRTADVYVINTHAIIDTENNFPKVNGNANARNTTQVSRYSNAVHPDTSGLNQIADCLRAFLKVYS